MLVLMHGFRMQPGILHHQSGDTRDIWIIRLPGAVEHREVVAFRARVKDFANEAANGAGHAAEHKARFH